MDLVDDLKVIVVGGCGFFFVIVCFDCYLFGCVVC